MTQDSESAKALLALTKNPARLDALINSMAQMLGTVLSMHDPDISKRTFATLLKEEKEVFPSREKLDKLEQIKVASEFVNNTGKLAARLKKLAFNNPAENMDLRGLEKRDGFIRGWSFNKQANSRTHRFRVGEIARQLGEEVETRCFKWIKHCENLLSQAFGDFGDDVPSCRFHQSQRAPPSCGFADVGKHGFGAPAKESRTSRADADAEVEGLLRLVSKRIAGLISLDGSEPLTRKWLEDVAREEYACTRPWAEVQVQDLLVALHSLHMLSTCEDTENFEAVVAERMHHICFLVNTPPPELGSAEAIDGINLKLLASAARQNVELRREVARKWKAIHGPFAAQASAGAIAQLREWLHRTWADEKLPIEKRGSPLQKVVVAFDASEDRLPTLPFVHAQYDWQVDEEAVQSTVRTGLDFVGRRIVRIVSMIAQFLDIGEFTSGVIASGAIENVAVTSVLAATHVQNCLNIKRDSLSEGCSLLGFLESITDVEGSLYDEITNALCNVSMFSFLEMHVIFGKNSPIGPQIMTKFTQLTREFMTHPISETYFAVAFDALVPVMRIIEERRRRLGRPLSYRPNPVRETLMTIPKVKEWTPTAGTLRVEQADTKGAASFAWIMLQELHRRKHLVKISRPIVAGQKASKPQAVFESLALYNLLYSEGSK